MHNSKSAHVRFGSNCDQDRSTPMSASTSSGQTAAYALACCVPRAAVSRCSKLHLYSITSSASNCIEVGTARPSALAAFMLITSSNLVGCSTGNSLGCAPRRMRPA